MAHKVKPLSLKGDEPKKKKKSSKSKSLQDPEALKEDAATSSTSKAKLDSPGLSQEEDSGKTAAELRFEKEQLKRLAAKVAKNASKSHKDRVAEFNAKLESLSEHHDIPKVGPG